MKTDKLTTAEIYSQRDQRKRQKQARMAKHMLAFGTICSLLGVIIYLSPLVQAAEGEGFEADVVDVGGPSLITASEDEYAYFTGDASDPSTRYLDDGFTSFDWDAYDVPKWETMSEDDAEQRARDILDTPLDESTCTEGHLIVSMMPGTTDDDISDLVTSTGCYVLETLAPGDESDGAILLLSTGSEPNLRQAQSKVLSHSTVLSCTPNYLMEMSDDPEVADADSDATEDADDEDAVVESWYDEDSEDFADALADGDGEPVTTDTLVTDSLADEEQEDAEEALADEDMEGDSSSYDENGNFVTFIEASPEDDNANGNAASAESAFTTASDPNDKNRWDYTELKYEEAWQYSQTNKKLTVAVIDNCFNVNAEDLRNLIVDKYNATGSNTNMKIPTTGVGSHGTHVAGIVGAEAGNGMGTSGLSHNAALMLIQAGTADPTKDERTLDSAGLIRALEYVVQNADGKAKGIPPIRVLNMSISAKANNQSEAQALNKVFRSRFDKLNQKGILVVAAAGNNKTNDPNTPVFPACYSAEYPNIVGVININKDMKKSDTSNWNPSNLQADKYVYQLSAPGSNILSTYGIAGGQQSDRGVGEMSGTSQAAPQVAGLASLIIALNPNLTAGQVRNYMCSTTKDIGSKGIDPETGYGEINPVAALQKVASDKAKQTDAQKQQDEEKKKQQQEEEARKQQEAEAQKKQQEEEARRKQEAEAQKKQQEEARKQQEVQQQQQQVTPEDHTQQQQQQQQQQTPTQQDQSSGTKTDTKQQVTPVNPSLPHARISYDWTDSKSTTPQRYQMSLQHLDGLPTDATKAQTSSDAPTAVELIHITKSIGKTAPTQSTVTEFFNNVVPTKEGASKGNASFPTEVTDGNTKEKWTVVLESSVMGTEKTLAGTTDGTVQYRTCRYLLTNQTTKATAHLEHTFWIADSEISAGATSAGAATLSDLFQSMAWVNSPITLRTSDASQSVVADMTGDTETVITTESHPVAEQGITSVDAPFKLAEGGCVAKEKNIGKIVGQGTETRKIDEYVYQVTIACPEATVTPIQQGVTTAADAAKPITKTLDVTIRTTTSMENNENMPDVTNAPAPQPSTPSDPFEALKDIECWIGGTQYKEFSYDRFDYTITYDAGNEFPSAPEMKNIPTDAGWKVEGTSSSGIVEQDGQRHRITLTNSESHVAREYTFSYVHEASDNPISQFFGNANTSSDPSSSSSSGGSSSGDASDTGNRRKLAATGGTLVQTGDAVLIVGGASIALASGAWLIVYGRTKENQA